MLVIPAIDIRNGKCVRLKQGRREDETIFSEDPVQVAQKWAEEGATLIHVVDLDGAFEKQPVNRPIIQRIVNAIDVPVQVGGGIRNHASIEAFLGMGVKRVVIGTEALKHPEWVKEAAGANPGRIAVGIDAKGGYVAVEGWTQTTSILAVDLAMSFEGWGVGAIIFTDILKDGMQTGPNIESTREFASAISTPVIASGGVSSLKDIQNLLVLEDFGVIGVITGRALYSNAFRLSDAIRTASQ